LLAGKASHAKALSPSHEHYLRALWEVHTRRGYARLTDVARELGVTPPTISVGLKPLVARGLVTHDDHRFLLLTAAGERIAREVHHRFAVMRTFLKDVLGVTEESALREACLLEHDVSAGTTERLLDLIKLLRDDRELREFFQHRFAEYQRSCRPASECSTCDLACFTRGDARPA
jgi:DtxR family transcriptional regulator, Mn-dependent transcriptional regulator